jgi:hypothetical protein
VKMRGRAASSIDRRNGDGITRVRVGGRSVLVGRNGRLGAL